CLWCAGGKLQSWAQSQGGEALLFAAGIGAQAASASPPAATASPAPASSYLLQDDGMVPLGETSQPQPSPAPDPNRDWAPVEEILLEGGTQVADFFVKDSTGSGTDLLAALEEEPSVHLQRDGSVEILIYHTHT